MDIRRLSLQCGVLKDEKGTRNPVFEIPGGMLFGTRIDLRVRPTDDFKKFLIALQSDFHGSTDPGVALEISYTIDVPEIRCRAVVGNQVIRSVVANVKREMFEDRFFVLSIATHPSGFKIYVDSIYLTEQRHFMDVTNVQFLRIDGDLVVYCAEVNNNFSNRHLLPIQDVPDVRGKVYEIPNLKEKGSTGSSPSSSLNRQRRSSPSVSQSSISTPKLRDDYAALISELDEQSVLVDDEIREINRARSSPSTRYENHPVEIPSADTSENEDLEAEQNEPKKRNKKTRFESFMKKIKRKGRKKKSDVPVMDTSESEFSTDFENYLMGTDSEVSISSRDSPTEILQQVGDEELIRLASQGQGRRQSDEKPTKYYYTVTGQGEEPVAVPLAEVLENGESGPGKVKVVTHDGRTVEIERTKLRICTQVVGEGETVMSESTADCTSDPGSPVQYHVIHHHVHHHVDDPHDESWDSYHQQIPPPKYESDYVDPEAGKPTNKNKSRLGLLCCYGV